MGWVLAIVAAAALIGFLIILARQAFGPGPRREQDFEQPDGSFIWGPAGMVETVDIIEGAGVVEQQRSGRELWRRVVVQVPNRPLSYEEELNLETAMDDGNPNVEVKK